MSLEATLHALFVIRITALARGGFRLGIASLVTAGEGVAAGIAAIFAWRGLAARASRLRLGLLWHGGRVRRRVHARGNGRRRRMHAGRCGHHQIELPRVLLLLVLTDAQRGPVYVSARESTYTAPRVVQLVSRLAVSVAVEPRRPTRLPMRDRDVLLQVQAIAMLEAHATFVNGLNTRAATAHAG